MAKFDVVVFDLDGTLIDSAPDIQVALNKFLASVDRSPLSLEAVTGLIGDGSHSLIRKSFKATGAAVDENLLEKHVEAYLCHYEANIADLTTVFPGVELALEQLRSGGFKVALCTNKPMSATRNVLKALKLDSFFDFIAAGDSYPVKKPHPDHISLLLTDMGIAPGNAAYVGDSAYDAEAALGANVTFILIEHGYPANLTEDLKPHAAIGSFETLQPTLSGL